MMMQLEYMQGQLRDVLRALAVSFGDVGYCQGLDYVAAHLMKCLGVDGRGGFASDPDRLFAVLAGMFEGYALEHLYSEDLEALQLMLNVLDLLMERSLPRLHQHFLEQGVDVAFFAVGWFQTLFLYVSCMPSQTLMHLWDMWVTERSYKVFFRAALAILQLSEEHLLELDLESIMLYLNSFPHEAVLEPDVLIPVALATKVTNSILREAQRALDEGDACDRRERDEPSPPPLLCHPIPSDGSYHSQDNGSLDEDDGRGNGGSDDVMSVTTGGARKGKKSPPIFGSHKIAAISPDNKTAVCGGVVAGGQDVANHTVATIIDEGDEWDGEGRVGGGGEVSTSVRLEKSYSGGNFVAGEIVA
ncbi:unnamed protein product [Choristocarpus tenellus]